MSPDYKLPFTPEFLKKLMEGEHVTLRAVLGSCPGMFERDEGKYYFEPPIGTEIVACRSGRVVEIDKTPLEEIRKLSHVQLHNLNLVLVDHGDGTYINYLHIDSKLKKGDRVNQGENLGNLIRGSQKYDPHLHLHFHNSPNDKKFNRFAFFSDLTFSNSDFSHWSYLGKIPNRSKVVRFA